MKRKSSYNLNRLMNIYVQKPWRVSDCSSYKLIKENPPKGVSYANMSESNLIQNKKGLTINNFIKNFIKKTLRNLYPTMPNAHYTPDASKYDLIHCEHCLSKNKYPWICNMEYVGQLWATGIVPKSGGKRQILKLLKRPCCKRIITWTKWTKDEIVKIFPELESKIEVVYPGIPTKKVGKISKKNNKIKLLYVSRRFYFKGGLYAVEVMDRLTKKYNNVEAIVVSDVPKEILEKYSKNKKINFMGMVPQKKLLEEIYPMCDIFVYPSFTDTFGFAIIEAMGFGLPVVSASGHSRKELIEDDKTGFVVKNPFEHFEAIVPELKNLNEVAVKNLEHAADKLIIDNVLRKKMSLNCKKIVKNGKFSIDYRNKRLKEIYLGALKEND